MLTRRPYFRTPEPDTRSRGLHLNNRRPCTLHAYPQRDAMGVSVLVEAKDEQAASERYRLKGGAALRFAARICFSVFLAYIFAPCDRQS
jgi:hypothetical protein